MYNLRRMPKPTLILIHGYRGTHHGLSLIAEHLDGLETITPDLPGFAEGDRLDEYTLDSYVSWLHAFIQKQNLTEAPFLLGHSFGSIITATYAARYPETIKKLILVNPIGAPALEGPRGILSKLAAFYYWTGSKLPKKIAQQWLASDLVVWFMSELMTKSKDKTMRAYVLDQHRKYFSLFHSPKSVSDGFIVSISHSVRDVATDISVPTLLIAGAEDDITSVKQQEIVRDLFPNARLEVIEKVGHLTHYETPKQVAELTQAFITSV